MPQKTPTRKSQKFSAMHATTASIAPTVIWKVARSIGSIMDVGRGPGKRIQRETRFLPTPSGRTSQTGMADPVGPGPGRSLATLGPQGRQAIWTLALDSVRPKIYVI